MLKKIFLFIALVFLSAAIVQAQVTTSSITGKITDNAGAPLSGATVTATHTPTGTVYKGTTNESGNINLGNVRVGGPYKIEITYVGYTPDIQQDVYLELGQPYLLQSKLSTGGQAMEEVVVVGRTDALLKRNRVGTATTVTRAQIENLPSITRGLGDVTRLTPQANGSSIGGGNYRSNNFTIDGANFNNQFGIGQNVPGGGAPISLDAIEQVSINLTPYDVRQSGFTGAAVNAVTRSGRNEFFGTAFYTGRSDKQQGFRVDNTFAPYASLKVQQFGASIGGPIIKNKLFFFLNYEQLKQTDPGPSKVASSSAQPFGASGTPSYVARPTFDSMTMISNYLRDKYGYETGPFQGYSNESYNKKMFGRIDWNISANHKINLRYSQVESETPSTISTSTTGSGLSFSSANNRASSNALTFANSNYFQQDNLYTGTLEYNGKIGRLNQSFRASYINQNSPRRSPGAVFPLVDILNGSSVYTTFGYEPFTLGNLRSVKTYTFNYDANMIVGNNNFTGGVQFETSKTQNGFQRFGTGYYVFNSWADFMNNAKPSNYAITYSLNPDGSQAFPSFKFNQLSLYIQDEYTVNSRLRLTAGLRVELPSYPNVAEIKTHPLVDTMQFANGARINTGALPKTTPMFSPRFGFNYDILGDRSVVLRGGSGVFTGRIPFVWIVAQSGDAAMLQITQYWSGQANTPGVFNPDIAAYIPNPLPEAGKTLGTSVSAMSPNLKFPSTWKSSLGVDVKLPFNIIGTIEGIYNKDINAVVARNVGIVDPTQMNIPGYADHRYMYPGTVATRYVQRLAVTPSGYVPSNTGPTGLDAIIMDNAKGGNYWSLNFQLTKTFEKGFSGMIAYTRSGAKNFGDGSGDQILNLWSIPYQNGGNSNTPSLSFTDNVLPNRLMGSVSYTNNWIGNLKTSMTLFYSGANQGRYSYYYTSDFNRDNQTNDLIYIPKDASEITFAPIAAGTTGYTKAYTAQEQSDIFFNLIENDPYLKSRKGQLAERNGALMPWRHQFDFHFSQQLFNGIGGIKQSLEVFWDVFNIGNLFNSKWGVYKIANNGVLTPTNTSSLSPTGTTIPTFRVGTANGDIIRETFRTNQTTTSTYYMQFGLRYNFN